MDNPFSADKGNPFQTPYQQQPQAAPGIKPFAAVDLAPPAGHNGQRLNAPDAPAGSPFTGGDFGSAFLKRESSMASGLPPMGQPAAPQAHSAPLAGSAPAAAAQPLAPLSSAPLGNPQTGSTYMAKSAPTKPDFTPAAGGMPASVRQSTILSMSDFNEVVNMHKPEFFITTTQQVDGYPIGTFLGVVSVEIVIPKDLLFRNPAPHGEMHRLKAAEEQLQKVKVQAFAELGEKARKIGADGVVGASLSFSQFDAVVFLCSAVGTAVKLAD
jgi:uncharacterized protein YbjQ (UPF0145 family)